MRNLKILIADDEPDVLEITAKKLDQAGYQVVRAKDGEEAINNINIQKPDVVILDINMPYLNGFEILQRIRETPPDDKYLPAIIVSAKGDLEDLKKGYSLDADHYIAKPCTFDDILKALEKIVELLPHRKA